MGVTTTNNKPLNPRGNDQSPLAYNRAALYSGKALDFDGANDSVSVGTLSGDVYATTFLTYTDANITASTSTQTLINFATGSGNEAFKFGVSTGFLTDETFSILLPNSARVGIDKTIPKGWNFWAVCWDGSTYKIYQNGQEQETITNGTASVISMGLVELGKEGSGQYFNGSLSNFKVYSTALTAAQVADLYNNPEKIVPTGMDNTALKLWLPMMEGAGTTAYDGSGNGNHGTIAGATYVNGVGAPVAQTSVIDWNKGTNLVAYSEEFNVWNTNSLSVAQSATIAPDGSTNAFTLTDNNNTAYGICFATYTLSMSGNYVASVFIKKTTGLITNYPGLDIAQRGSYLIIDTTNGTSVESGSGSNYSDVTITSYNDDWWRVSAKTNHTNNAYPIRLWPAISSNGTNIAAEATGNATFWGAQVESTDTLGAYTPNHTGTPITTPVLLPQGLTTGRDITGVNLFENVRKQGALNLDGSSYAEVHDNASLDITGHITLEAWVYWDDSVSQGILSKWDYGAGKASYLILKISETKFRFYVSSTGSNAVQIENTTTITSGWNHLVGVYDGTNIKCYLNGSVDGSTAYSAGLFPNDLNLEIGKYGSEKYPNDIAQPRIYNRALTAEEVQRNYNAGKNIYS